jgi:hypothetical protein
VHADAVGEPVTEEDTVRLVDAHSDAVCETVTEDDTDTVWLRDVHADAVGEPVTDVVVDVVNETDTVPESEDVGD